jgi:hypothetical protein
MTSSHSPSLAGHVVTFFTTRNCAMLCYLASSRATGIVFDTLTLTQLVVSMSSLATSAILVSTVSNNFTRFMITDDGSVVSQHLPLHHYPTLALTTLSSSGTAALEEKIRRLVMLCQAHSRMILLLQALIHSASSLVREEQDDPSLRYRNSAQQGGRELIFPAPLSFTPNDGDSNANAATQPSGHFRFFSMPSTAGRARHTLKVDPPRRSPSVMTILRRSTVPPPPPEADPLGLKIYAGSWRGRKRMFTVPSQTSKRDEKVPRRPKLVVSPPDSSGSSTVNSPSPLSAPQAEISPITITMPHDIRAATSRLRAPILRVFFPCSKVDHRTITACEAQLDEAGLWEHLSVGDIICNLGYLPPSDGAGPSGNAMSFDDASSPESWMIFDGTVLVPYTPSAILPISEPLSLPSPFYYAHITPPPINPRFTATLPREEPELSLMLLPTKVPSRHSPNGFVRIRKHMWLAHLRPHVRPGLGEGWHGEWILEGEGTKEGRQTLLDALNGYVNVKREWELVMERSTPTRIWLRSVWPEPQKVVTFSRLTKTSRFFSCCRLISTSPFKDTRLI